MFTSLRNLIFQIRARFYRYYTPKIRRYYDQSVVKHGDSIKSLGWRSNYSQQIRFDALVSQWRLGAGDRVLDVGCGFGDFYDYVKDIDPDVVYRGIDVSDKMIEMARQKNPGANFEVGDIFTTPGLEADFVVASGVFSLHTRDQYHYLELAIQKMLAIANKGVALNMLSDQTPKSERGDELFFYYDPKQVIDIVSRYSKRWVALHHYLENDFTVVLNR